MDSKIYELPDLAVLISQLKKEQKTIVHCHGVFDLMHPGHLKYFKSAKQLGNILVVTITPDHYVNKGPNRPIYNQDLRAESVAALEVVNYVAINETSSAVETIYALRPNIYVKGKEYEDLKDLTGHITAEKKAVEVVGGEIAFVGETIFSSTTLLNEYFSILTPQTKAYLANLKQSYSVEYILEQIKLFENKKVLVIGDTIIDEYVFCEPIGIANKVACIDAKYLSKELQLGGAAGIANHLAQFCQSVHFTSCLESNGDYTKFVKTSFHDNVNFKLLPTIHQSSVIKKRFLTADQLSSQIFELTQVNEKKREYETDQEMCVYLKKVVDDYDIVIIADYGYGFINSNIITTLCQSNAYLAISPQTNSYNLGSNLLTKYPRANYICADEQEMRLASGDAKLSMKESIKLFSERQNCGAISLIMGEKGSINWTLNNGFTESVAFTTEVVDSTGASSAYFGITSLCAFLGFEPQLIGFIGNCVGAMMVRTLGHRESVTPTSLSRFITSLLK